MVAKVLVPILICLGGFALVFGIYYLRNRENMALIERGFNPRESREQPKLFVSLKYGLLLMGSGLGLLLACLLDGWLNKINMNPNPDARSYYDDNPALYFGLVALGGGLGLVLSYVIEKKYKKQS